MSTDNEPACAIHIRECHDEDLIEMTETRFGSFVHFSRQWLDLIREPELMIATRHREQGLLDRAYEDAKPVFCHAKCYKTYTERKHLQRCQTKDPELRQQRIELEEREKAEEAAKDGPPLKRRRAPGTAANILPAQCIICLKVHPLKRRSRGKRITDNLQVCQLKSGGLLRKAAEFKRDERVLIHIRDKDCVAIEVRYHAKCLRDYSRCIRGESSAGRDEESSDDGSDDSPVLPLPRHQSSPQSPDTMDKSTDTTTTQTSSGDFQTLKRMSGSMNARMDIYHAGVIVNRSIKDLKPPTLPWPPGAADFDESTCNRFVPKELYSLLSVVTGISDDPENELPDDPSGDELRLLSICQDLVYLTTNGKVQTPKAMALGLALRHMTGSSHVARLIHGLGHCSSYDSILRHETSLAEAHTAADSQVPLGFSKGVPTIAIWDNIDWLEETLSGAGTTHFTNGILVQRERAPSVTDDHRPAVTRGRRTLQPTTSDLTPFYLRSRHGPQDIELSSLDVTPDGPNDHHKTAATLDTTYAVLKYYNQFSQQPTVLQNVPSWTGFNRLLKSDGPTPTLSAIHYLPVIEAPPTDNTTVMEIFNRSSRLCHQLEIDEMVLVFDQAIFSKAQIIRWDTPELRQRFILRLGEFHTAMSFLGILGKRYGPAGLQDVLVEGECVAQGSMNSVLSGHNFNRALRAHKIMYEALCCLRLQQFMDSVEDEQRTQYHSYMSSLELAYPDRAALIDLHDSELGVTFHSHFTTHVQREVDQSPVYSFWNGYIAIVELLLTFIRATRESNWELHLWSIRRMMPWYFAYDKINYARYLPAYWCEMMDLNNTHPNTYASFMDKGQWTVQRTTFSFASIACDQAIEQTVNRDSKTSGGLTGRTQNRGAFERWILAQPDRSAITRQCESLAGLNDEMQQQHKECDVSYMKQHSRAVLKMTTTMENMVNPFTCDMDGLVSISSGMVANADVTRDLVTAHGRGEAAAVTFIEERIRSRETDFFKPLKAVKLRQFGDRERKKQLTRTTVLKNDRNLFSRLVVVMKDRQVDLREILKYSLGPVSYPLASADGSIAKTNKASLLAAIEAEMNGSHLVLPDSQPLKTALMVDGMALLQCIQVSRLPATFGELAAMILKELFSLASYRHATRVDFVTDQYPPISIKNCERERRASSGHEIVRIYSPSQNTPRLWKKFMSHGENKTSLVKFMCDAWETLIPERHASIEVFTCNAQKVTQLSYVEAGVPPVVRSVPELQCDHEEADTRLLLHARHAAEADHDHVIIRSPDTDVAVIAIHHQATIGAALYFATGTKDKARLLSIPVICETLGQDLCSALIGLHSISGCDSTSAFYGKGKKTVLTTARRDPSYLEALSHLGDEFSFDDTGLPPLECFVSTLYGCKGVKSVDEARYKLFCTSTPSEQSLPPTSDALLHHAKRTNYQACIWRRALTALQDGPHGLGWNLSDEGELTFKWMAKDPAPAEDVQVTYCSCSVSKCSKGACGCKKVGLPCTDLCRCTACANRVSSSGPTESIDNDSDEE